MINFKQLKNDIENQVLVTKYVEEEFFHDTNKGKLKFGTLQEYRSAEKGVDKRLSDNLDGVERFAVPQPIINKSFVLDGNTYSNMTMINHIGPSMVSDHQFNAYVYCFVDGAYSREHHLQFIKNGNEKLSCYVVMDLTSFMCAADYMFSFFRKERLSNVLVATVNYVDEKTKNMELNDFANIKPNLIDAVFNKSREFEYENELRVAFFSNQEKTFLTQSVHSEVPKLFADAVVSFGAIS